MNKQLGRAIATIGKFLVVSTLFVVAIRSYTIDMFAAYKFKNMFPPAGEIMAGDTENFFFSVVSDTGARDEILEDIIRKIRKTDAVFILYLGDLVRYRNSSHFRWMAEGIYSELGGKNFYAIPGNHDVISENGNVDYSLYNSIFGQPSYWFSYGNTLFIALDSSEEKYSDEQIAWLKYTLEKLRPLHKYCIVFSHVPPISNLHEDEKTLDNESKIKFAEAIRGKNVNLLLSGHVHHFSESTFEGVPLITTPSSGQSIRGDIKNYGYVNVHVSPVGIDKIEVEYIDKKDDTTDYIELFFSSAIVKKEVALVSAWVFIFGILMIAAGKILKK